jgi:hypothetical protein
MSTATIQRFPAATAAVACAAVVGGAAALGIALSNNGDSTQPLAPTAECNSTSCAVDHPVLPGRHDFQVRPHGGFQPTTSGGKVMIGQ